MARVLIILGLLFLLGLLTDLFGRRTPLPRVTLLIFFGFVIGPSMLGVLPEESRDWFPVAADVALVMVGFLIGGGLSLRQLRWRGRSILVISSVEVLTAFVVVGCGLMLLGESALVAVLLATIAGTAFFELLGPIATRQAIRRAADSSTASRKALSQT